MKTTTFYLVFSSIFFFSTSTERQKFPNTVCGLDIPADPYELELNNTSVPANNSLHGYLTDIKKVFNQPYAQYNLRKIVNKDIAAAHLQRIGYNAAARVITINEDYFVSKVSSTAYKKALLIWVLAHEVQHHTNGDLHYDDKIVAANLKKEILADERAGYAVGKLTEVDIDFFEKTLPAILYPNKESKTHPPRDYRILAAKAGWIRAKLGISSEITVNSMTYKKIVESDGDQFWGRHSGGVFNGVGYSKYQDEDIYIGEKQDGVKGGIGLGAVAPCLKGDSGKIVIFKVTKRIKNVYLRYQDKDRTNFTDLYFNRLGNLC